MTVRTVVCTLLCMPHVPRVLLCRSVVVPPSRASAASEWPPHWLSLARPRRRQLQAKPMKKSAPRNDLCRSGDS